MLDWLLLSISGGSLVLLKCFSWYVGVNLLILYGQELLRCCGFSFRYFFFSITTSGSYVLSPFYYLV